MLLPPAALCGQRNVCKDASWIQRAGREGLVCYALHALLGDDGERVAADHRVGYSVGEEISLMLDPTPLLGSVRFTPTGRGWVAGHDTVTATAVARLKDPRRHPRAFELHQLGAGADRYKLQIDARRGVLLEAVAVRDDEPFFRITTVQITFRSAHRPRAFPISAAAGRTDPANLGATPIGASLALGGSAACAIHCADPGAHPATLAFVLRLHRACTAAAVPGVRLTQLPL